MLEYIFFLCACRLERKNYVVWSYIWWDNTIVAYNNYAHTVIRLTPSYIISIVLALEHSRFDEHVPLMNISYQFDCKQCALFHHIIIYCNQYVIDGRYLSF